MEGIDFVVTWVDGSDENWRRQKAEYSRTKWTDDSEERYRDWGLLKYWFRGVEQYAPWVRKVHLITWGHLPKWLNTDQTRLHIVRHEDYIPKQFLPTFNCNVLELNLHRIEGLSERFVYFNDDMYLTRKVKPEDFFTKGKPNDMLAFQPVVANPANPVMSQMLLNNSLVLCKYFDKRENVKRQPGNYFKIGYPPLYFFYNMLELAFPLYTGFYTVHGPYIFLKSTFEEVWEKEEALLTEVSGNRFRSNTDVTLYLFREWQKLSGNFKAKNIQRTFRYYNIMDNKPEMYRTIRKNKCNVVCLNDGPASPELETVKAGLLEAFDHIMPEKSSFERG